VAVASLFENRLRIEECRGSFCLDPKRRQQKALASTIFSSLCVSLLNCSTLYSTLLEKDLFLKLYVEAVLSFGYFAFCFPN
jgi:hypothetical protein